jgi:hypothetical protein
MISQQNCKIQSIKIQMINYNKYNIFNIIVIVLHVIKIKIHLLYFIFLFIKTIIENIKKEINHDETL